MSIKQAIEARALKLADSRLEDERGTYEWSLDAEITLRECAAALVALRSMPAEPVHQFRVPNTCTWFDGHADHTDGGGLYEERTLFTTPHTAPLSDAEILEMWEEHKRTAWNKTLISPVVFARAIERAVLRGGEQ